MEVFCYNPKDEAESEADFNRRLKDYCGQANVANICATIGRRGLLVALTLAEDLPAGDHLLLTCEVRVLREIWSAAEQEEVVGKILEAATVVDDACPSIPLEAQIVYHPDIPHDLLVIKSARGILTQQVDQ